MKKDHNSKSEKDRRVYIKAQKSYYKMTVIEQLT